MSLTVAFVHQLLFTCIQSPPLQAGFGSGASGSVRSADVRSQHLGVLVQPSLCYYHHTVAGMGINKNLTIPIPLSILLINTIPYRFSLGEGISTNLFVCINCI